MHYVDHVATGEDANRPRSGSGPQVLAALRNLAVSKLRLDEVASIASALRRKDARVRDLMVSLGILKN